MLKNVSASLLALLLIIMSSRSGAQTFALSKDKSLITVEGSSTLHNWKMELKTFDCNAGFVIDGTSIKNVQNVAFSCNSNDLKSESSLMDKKAHSALKSEKSPEIKFNVLSSDDPESSGSDLQLLVKGNLIIAGKSNAITVPVKVTLTGTNGNYRIDVNGEADLKMSDFNITPPTLMLGTLKVGDEIKVKVSMEFVQG